MRYAWRPCDHPLPLWVFCGRKLWLEKCQELLRLLISDEASWPVENEKRAGVTAHFYGGGGDKICGGQNPLEHRLSQNKNIASEGEVLQYHGRYCAEWGATQTNINKAVNATWIGLGSLDLISHTSGTASSSTARALT